MYNYRKLDKLPVLNLFINFYFYLHREHAYRLSIYVFYISSMDRNKLKLRKIPSHIIYKNFLINSILLMTES